VVVTCGRPRWMAPYVGDPIRHDSSPSSNPEKGEAAGRACYARRLALLAAAAGARWPGRVQCPISK
jgi:hypothetical protein